MENILNSLFWIPEDKLDKTFHKKCVEFIKWVDTELDETALESGLSSDFATEARKEIDNLKAVSDYLREVQEQEETKTQRS